MMNYYKLLICTLMLATGPVFAWYQVEVIIFEHTSPDTGNEFWNQEPGLVPLSGTVIPVPELLHEGEAPVADDVLVETPPRRLVPYMLLSEDKYRLEGVFRALRQSREFRPLYHVSWQQPEVDGNQARAVHLQLVDNTILYEITLPPTLIASVPTEFYEPIQLVLDGIVRVRSSNFLHVDVDMVLFKQPPHSTSVVVSPVNLQQVNLIEQPPAYIRLNETRRIRLNELHYFDHPLFGVILQISRYAPD